MAHYRKKGWEIALGQRHVKTPIGPRSFDLFGFGDLLMYNVSLRQTALVQVTSGQHGAERRNKILANRHAAEWLRCGNKIYLCLLVKRQHTLKTGPYKGKKKESYEVVEQDIVI